MESDAYLSPEPSRTGCWGNLGQEGMEGLLVQRQLDEEVHTLLGLHHPPTLPVLCSKIFGAGYPGTLGSMLKLFLHLRNKMELISCRFI